MQEHKNKIQNFKVYIINLDKDIDRMTYMIKQMQDLNIEYERIPAIYGKEYDFGEEYIESLAIKKNGKVLVPGELGCAKSHKLCYEKILKINSKEKTINNKNKYSLILEDDVCLPKNFKQIVGRQIELNEVEKNLKNKLTWDYLLFDYPRPGKFFIHHWINSLFLNYKNLNKKENSSNNNIKNKENIFLKKLKFILYSFAKACYILPMAIYEWLRNIYYNNHKYNYGKAVRFYRPLYLAGAYLITTDAASMLYSLTNPIVYPADRTPDEARKQLGMKFFAYAPLCVYQKRESFGSSILDIDSIEEIPV